MGHEPGDPHGFLGIPFGIGMRIRLIAIGTRMPEWVRSGFVEYASRLPRQCALELTEIPLGKRARSAPVAKAVEEEGERMLAALHVSDRVISLDVSGVQLDTEGVAQRLEQWMQDGSNVALLVGGPDGLAGRCLERSESRWALSKLTLPHGLVRVVVAEQLYRAWSILNKHPYHRP